MRNKREAVNILFTTEMNEAIKSVASDMGMTKSRTIRFICMDYLTKKNKSEMTLQQMHHHL
jgi:hypothetical protein